ncbi:hypothetical protein TNCV_1573781 [Trichonephila clavipes]|nr:hypothetical protein TNCV_1573781 [Trichonephila clavipes]
MTPTSYRSRSAVCVRHFFRRGTTLLSDRVLVHSEQLQIYPTASRAAAGVHQIVSDQALLCCPVASCCTRNDDNDILPRTRGGRCLSPFFRRSTTLLSVLVLLPAEL